MQASRFRSATIRATAGPTAARHLSRHHHRNENRVPVFISNDIIRHARRMAPVANRLHCLDAARAIIIRAATDILRRDGIERHAISPGPRMAISHYLACVQLGQAFFRLRRIA